MMGGIVARNTQSKAIAKEKNAIVASCWTYFTTTSCVHYTTSRNTQFSTPEDVRVHRPKYVELIGIIKKPLYLHLVSVCIIYKTPTV